MAYTFHCVAIFAACAIVLARSFRRLGLGLLETLIVGAGVGYVAFHGALLSAALFLPFRTAFAFVSAIGDAIFLYALARYFRADDLYRARSWLVLRWHDRKDILRPGKITVFVLMAALVAWYLAVYLNTFVVNNGTYTGAIAGLGDVPYHIGQISHMAVGPRLLLDDPAYAGVPLRYPFLINFMSAVLLRLGAPLTVAYHVPGIFFGAGSVVLLYMLLLRLSGQRRSLAFSGTVLILFSSNTRYLLLAHDRYFTAWQGAQEIFRHLAHLPFRVAHVWDASFPNQNVDAISLLPLFLLHQRASIMGFWTMLAIILLWLVWVRGDEPVTIGGTVPLGILIAMFPLLHTHGFVALSVASFMWVLHALATPAGRGRALLLSLLWTLPFIFWQLSFLLAQNPAYTFAPHWRLGWMSDKNEIGGIRPDPSGAEALWVTWLRFMWQNYGVLLPVGVSSSIIAWFSRKKVEANALWLLVPGSLLLFAFANVFKLQAWDVDTNKLLAFDIFFNVAMLVMLLAAFAKVRPRTVIGISYVLLAFAVPTGILDVYGRTPFLNPAVSSLFDADRVAVGRWADSCMPFGAVVVSSDDHLNPINTLGGRSAIRGYEGWLWTHGITYTAREELISDFTADPRAKSRAFTILGPAYVLLDPKWRHDYPELDGKLHAAFGLPAFSSGPFAVWKLPE